MNKEMEIYAAGNKETDERLARMEAVAQKQKNDPVVVGVDLAKDDDYGVEFKGHYEDGKLVITDLKYLNLQKQENLK
jgi:hypothetical protein